MDSGNLNTLRRVRFVIMVGFSCGFLLLATCGAAAVELTVFAAASLTDALTEVGHKYEAVSSDTVSFNFAASSLLARQIAAGAPADIFFSADEARMNDLARAKLVLDDTRKDRLSNTLVIITPADGSFAIHSASDLTNAAVRKIALADPAAVPAGVYAKQYLESQKLWSAVEPKVVPTENVRGALVAVESGNVEAGIVFQTDAAISRQVKVVMIVPRKDGPPIRYPMAVMREARHVEAARRFLQYLGSEDAGAIFRRYGFVVLP